MNDIPSSAFIAGGICLDSVIRLGEFPEPEPGTIFARSYVEQLGGTGAGKALALAKLGFSSTLYAFCGDDDAGALASAELAAGGVDFIKEIDALGTERHTNLVDDEGRRISIYTNAGSFEPECREAERAVAALQTTGYPILNIINRVRSLIPAARAAGKGIWTDLHDYDGKDEYHRDFLEAADYVFLSSDRMPGWKKFMRRQIDAGKKLVVVTHGAEGANLVHHEAGDFEIAALPVELVDSNGAGDNFFAGFLYGFDRGYPPERCLALAAAAGALCVSARGLVHPDLCPALLEATAGQLETA